MSLVKFKIKEPESPLQSIKRQVLREVLNVLPQYIPAPIKGEPGEKGEPGKDGRDGVDGKDGKDGKMGPQGEPGRDGKDGRDGSNAEFPEDYVDNLVKNIVEKEFKDIKRELSRTAPRASASGGGGSGSMAYVNISSDTTIDARSRVALVNTSGGNITVTLPSAASAARQELHVKKADASGNVLTVAGNGSQTIDGDSTAVLVGQYVSIRLYSDGSNWHII